MLRFGTAGASLRDRSDPLTTRHDLCHNLLDDVVFMRAIRVLDLGVRILALKAVLRSDSGCFSRNQKRREKIFCLTFFVSTNITIVVFLKKGKKIVTNLQRIIVLFTQKLSISSGSGMGKKSGSGSGIRVRDEQPESYFRELRNKCLG